MAWAGSRARRRPAASSTHEPQPGHPRVLRAQVRGARADRGGRRRLRPQRHGPGGLRALAQPCLPLSSVSKQYAGYATASSWRSTGPRPRPERVFGRDLSRFHPSLPFNTFSVLITPEWFRAYTPRFTRFRSPYYVSAPFDSTEHCRLACLVCRHPLSSKFGAPAVVAKRHARDGGQHTLCSAARGRSHVLGTRQPSPRDGGSDGGRLLLRQWRHLQRHSEQDCNRCGSSSNHTSTLAYAGRARGASSEPVRRNPTLPVHALLQAPSARHGRSTSPSPRRTRWAACRPRTRRSR